MKNFLFTLGIAGLNSLWLCLLNKRRKSKTDITQNAQHNTIETCLFTGLHMSNALRIILIHHPVCIPRKMFPEKILIKMKIIIKSYGFWGQLWGICYRWRKLGKNINDWDENLGNFGIEICCGGGEPVSTTVGKVSRVEIVFIVIAFTWV